MIISSDKKRRLWSFILGLLFVLLLIVGIRINLDLIGTSSCIKLWILLILKIRISH